MVNIELSHIEISVLKKLALVNAALAKTLQSRVAGGEQLALTRVLIDIVNRAELAEAAARGVAAEDE